MASIDGHTGTGKFVKAYKAKFGALPNGGPAPPKTQSSAGGGYGKKVSPWARAGGLGPKPTKI